MARKPRSTARPLSKGAFVSLAVCAAIAFALLYRNSSNGGIYLDSDAECLARVVRSEIGIGTTKQKLHVAWVARNLAREKAVSVSALVCSPVGRQGTSRPLSSAQEGNESDLHIAKRVLAAQQKRDPTRGATHFINPRLQDQLAKRGKRKGYKSRPYNKIRRHWKRVYGWEPYYRIGPTLEFWGPKRKGKSRRSKS